MYKWQGDFPQLRELLSCTQLTGEFGEVIEEGWVSHGSKSYPLLSLVFGPKEPSVPTLIIVGGVHGLEQIGTDVILSYLRTFLRLLKWDELTQEILKRVRMVFYPIANPIGMARGTRANGRGVDLMRNAAVEAKETRLPLVGGHRITRYLPWYRGDSTELEVESQVLMAMVRRYLSSSALTLSLDVHSGFGLVDRLWFPFAYTKEQFPDCDLVLRLMKNLDRTYPHHIYKIEPQSSSYTAHGDLWDALYLEHQELDEGRVFIPLSLEMGSWHWIRKNPKQILSAMGIFNPILPHRMRRIQRRHIALFDFLLRSVCSYERWIHIPTELKKDLERKAKTLWY